MWYPGMNSNMNFPSLLSIPGFAAALIGGTVAVAVIAILFFAKQRKAAKIIAVITGSCAIIYIALLFGCSLVSKQKVLSRGQEKYFCEVDCHLAYSVVSVKEEAGATAKRYVVALKTRFDETTISKRSAQGFSLDAVATRNQADRFWRTGVRSRVFERLFADATSGPG